VVIKGKDYEKDSLHQRGLDRRGKPRERGVAECLPGGEAPHTTASQGALQSQRLRKRRGEGSTVKSEAAISQGKLKCCDFDAKKRHRRFFAAFIRMKKTDLRRRNGDVGATQAAARRQTKTVEKIQNNGDRHMENSRQFGAQPPKKLKEHWLLKEALLTTGSRKREKNWSCC